MWYGRLTFRLKSDDEIKSGILITLALNKANNQSSWNKIYEPVNFFVGKSDDITYYQFKDLVEKVYGASVLGIILTGMGKDGVEGLKKLKQHGGAILAQNEDSCVVYGMPKAAVDAGIADAVLPIDAIIESLKTIGKRKH